MEISLETIWRTLQKHIILIIIISIAAGVLTYTASELLITPQYVSQAKINILAEQDSEMTASQSLSSFSYINKILKTCTQVLDTRDFKELVRSKVELDYSPQLNFSYDSDSTVLVIKSSDSNPTVAYDFARATVECVGGYIEEKMATTVVAILVETPELPQKPDSPKSSVNAVLVMICAVILTYGIELLIELFGKKIKDETELTRRFPDIPIIAAIPDFNENMMRRPTVLGRKPNGEEK